MRCQKVRSCLSAYCNDELTGRAARRVSDHLTNCTVCRGEEQQLRSIMQGSRELNTFKVSAGFNNRLLDRIAHERFAETRTKAYFPKPVPSLWVRRLVPILATAFLAAFVVISNFTKSNNALKVDQLAVNQDHSLNDDYLTVQPVNNPNMTSTLRQGWSLDEQLNRSERITRISQQLISNSPFNYYGQGNAVNVSTRSFGPVPFVEGFYRVRPVFRVFESTTPNANKEESVTY
ncbi:MAG: anti-sigma factor family protein [Candidatus Zixiibacteriota bacterium]